LQGAQANKVMTSTNAHQKPNKQMSKKPEKNTKKKCGFAWAICRGNVSLPIVQHSGAPALNPNTNST